VDGKERDKTFHHRVGYVEQVTFEKLKDSLPGSLHTWCPKWVGAVKHLLKEETPSFDFFYRTTS
jgi:hypothetical protein